MFFLKAGEVQRWGGYTVNLIHYEDAAGISAAVRLTVTRLPHPPHFPSPPRSLLPRPLLHPTELPFPSCPCGPSITRKCSTG